MPLHDWSRLPEWDGVHQLWIVELYHDIKAKLPPGYRAGLGTVPSLTVGATPTHPDVSVQRSLTTPLDESGQSVATEEDGAFDLEVTVATLDVSRHVQVFRGNNLVSIVELISPSNKDRERTRQATIDRLVGYLTLGIHVLFVDVHAHPIGFSLADEIAAAIEYQQTPCPSPLAMAYRVSGPEEGGRRSLAVRRAPLTIGETLPTVPLPISPLRSVLLNLETTYDRTTRDYLSWLPSNGAGE